MLQNQNSLTRFWQELRRRKVFGVVTAYAATAYIIIEVTNNLTGPLGLPGWIATLVVILLLIGLPIAVIISWIFDFTPEGIRKTESLEEFEKKEVPVQPLKRKLKLSYVLNGVLLIALVILIWPKIFREDPVKRLNSKGEKLVVAVLPFKNMTNDTTWNAWQNGIQLDLITSLSNTGELGVRQMETMNTAIRNQNIKGYASLTPFLAGKISRQLKSDIFVLGSLQKAGPRMRIRAQLIDSESDDVLKSFEIDGSYDDNAIFNLTDTLRKKLVDFLIISKLIKENPDYRYASRTTSSPGAYRNYIYGFNALWKNNDCSSAITWFLKALEADSNFFYPYYDLITAYGNCGLNDLGEKAMQKCYDKRNQWPPAQKLWASLPYAYRYRPLEEVISIYNQLDEIDEFYNIKNLDIAWLYGIAGQPEKAALEYEKAIEKAKMTGNKGAANVAMLNLIEEYHKAGEYEKEKKLVDKASKIFKDQDHNYFILYKASYYLRKGDVKKAEKLFGDFQYRCKKFPAYTMIDSIEDRGYFYYKAGIMDKFIDHYRRVISLDPDNIDRMYRFLLFAANEHRTCDIKEYPELWDKIIAKDNDRYNAYLHLEAKGWAYYTCGKYKEAFEIIQNVWDSIPYKWRYINDHLETVKKAMSF